MISRVKESIVVFCEEDTRNGLPLLFRRINTRRVVRASMQQEHRTLRGALQRGNKSIKVEPNCFRVVIRIRALLDADVFEDGIVIGCIARKISVSTHSLREAWHVPHVGSLR